MSNRTRSKREFKIVDMHTHPFGNLDVDLSKAIKTRRDAVLLRRTDPELFRRVWENTEDITDLLLKDMDENKIAKAVIQPASGESPETVAKAVKRNPDRLIGLFMVNHQFTRQHDYRDRSPKEKPPKPDIKKFEQEVRYFIKDLGLRGLGEGVTYTLTQESSPNKMAEDMFPYFEILNEYKIPVLIASGWSQFGKPMYKGLPLFIDDLAERFTDIPFVITKMGRGYQYIFEMALAIAYKHLNVYLDTVHAPADHIARAVREVGADRVMFGTDWCLTWRQVELGPTTNIYSNGLAEIDEAGLSDDEKEWVLGKTAASVFGLTL